MLGANERCRVYLVLFTLSLFSAVPPEVTVSATKSRIAVNQSTTLTCSVTQSNPSSPTFEWIFTDTNDVMKPLNGETSETLQLSSIAKNQFGTYTCNATNSARHSGTAAITIEQGCKQLDSNSHSKYT